MQSPIKPQTRVSIRNGKWFINDDVLRGVVRRRPALERSHGELGFRDRRRPDFDPEANTDEFLAALPDMLRRGFVPSPSACKGECLAMKGVELGFEPDGSLRRGISPACVASSRRVTAGGSF